MIAPILLVFATLSGFISVAAGAFGAHWLRGRLEADMLAVFETAARYQMFHALALIGLWAVAANRPGPWWNLAGWSLAVGTVIFSGSLYALALTGTRWLGAITPIGGLGLLVGWALATLGAVRLMGVQHG